MTSRFGLDKFELDAIGTFEEADPLTTGTDSNRRKPEETGISLRESYPPIIGLIVDLNQKSKLLEKRYFAWKPAWILVGGTGFEPVTPAV